VARVKPHVGAGPVCGEKPISGASFAAMIAICCISDNAANFFPGNSVSRDTTERTDKLEIREIATEWLHAKLGHYRRSG
jgi:hypothetical protein